MFTVVKMKKVDKSLSGTNIMVQTRDGRSSILTKLKKYRTKDSMRTSVSISTDHSTSDQDFLLRELLNVLEQTTSPSRDIPKAELLSNSTSMQFPKPSDHSIGRTMPWKSKEMVVHPT